MTTSEAIKRGRRAFVQQQDLAGIGIPRRERRDDLLVDIAGERVPGSARRVAGFAEKGALFVTALFARDFGAEGFERAGVHLGKIVDIARFAAGLMPMPAAADQAALIIGVAQQDIQGDDQAARIVAVGLLHRAAVHLHGRALAVGGQLPGHLDDGLQIDAALLGVMVQGFSESLFGQQLEGALDLKGIDRGGHEQVALHGVDLVVGVHCDQLPVARHDHLLMAAHAGLVRPQELQGMAVDDLHQMGGVAPGGFVIRHGRRLVGIFKIALVVAVVFQDPADHSHGQRPVAVGLDRQPPVGFAGVVGEPRVDHSRLQAAADLARGHLLRHGSQAEVGGKRAGAPENDELGVGQVRLHVAALAARHPVIGDMVGLFADRGVLEGVLRSQGFVGEPLHDLLAAVFDTPGHEDKAVVLRSQIRMRRVDEHVEVGAVFCLELGQGQLALAEFLGVCSHGFGQAGIAQGHHFIEAGIVPLVAGVGEEFAAADHLVEERESRWFSIGSSLWRRPV